MQAQIIHGDDTTLRILRMASMLAAFLYIALGLLMKQVLAIDVSAPLFLLWVVPIMNLLFYRWEFLLYANIVLLLVIVGAVTASSPTLAKALLFLLSSAAIGGVSFWVSGRLLSAEVISEANGQMFQDLFHHSMEGIAIHEMIFDRQGKPADYVFLQINPAFEEYTGLNRTEILGKRGTAVLPGIEDSGLIARYGRVVQTGEPIRFEQFSEPLQRHYRVAAYATGLNRFATAFEDITERKQAEQAIEHLSFHDALTGLYNRRFFETECSRLDVPRNWPLALCMIDVNGLKLTNDAFGHPAGDELLRKVAESLQATCRADDVVARIGGDEFAIILPHTNAEQADTVMQRIQQAVAREEVKGLPISIAIGLGVKTGEQETMVDVFRTAEDFMYRRKTSERSSRRYQSVDLIMQTLYAKAPREQAHSHRVSELCEALGSAVGLSQGEINELTTAGLLHDIGKVAIPDDILDKAPPLTDLEWAEIRAHPTTGYNILSSVNDYGPLAAYVLAHHERWDGAGYPQGLNEEDIPLPARIIAIADTYVAMTSDRPYRSGIEPADAIKTIEASAGFQFDPDIVIVFLTLMNEEVPAAHSGVD